MRTLVGHRRRYNEIRDQRISLHGIDAPEGGRLCTIDRKSYRCGQQATLTLADKAGQGTVRCREKDVDRFGRIVAVCHLGREDLNAWMVSQGWAVAFRKYSLDYVNLEEEARRAKRGVWRGEFDAPWDWRAAHRRR